MKLGISALVIYFAIAILSIAGWISNVVWTFHQHDMTHLVLGILGAVVAPIGAVHGVITWF